MAELSGRVVGGGGHPIGDEVGGFSICRGGCVDMCLKPGASPSPKLTDHPHFVADLRPTANSILQYTIQRTLLS